MASTYNGRTVRRLGAAFAVLVTFLLLPAPSSAQGEDVTLRLARQTLYGAPEEPLRVRAEVENSGPAPLSDLSVAVHVFPEAGSRSEYEQALEFDAAFPALPPVTEEVEGTVEPGEPRLLPAIQIGLGDFALTYETGLYPVKVELLSAGVPIAVLRTVMVFVEEEPQLPLNVNLTFVLDAPLRMLPDGSFLEGALAREIAPGGRLEAALRALEAEAFPVTVVVSPLLLEQLARMGRGYRLHEGDTLITVPPDEEPAQHAVGFLETLREIAQRPETELVALPYASPSIPALTRPELGQDLRAQVSRGRSTVAELLGTGASETLFRAPGGFVSGPAVQQVAALGTEVLLLDAGAVEPLPEVDFTPPPAAQLAAGGSALQAIIPEPGVAARLRELPDDPRLRAQRLIGELSAIYFEFPGVDRGVSVVIDGGTSSGPRFLSALVQAVASLPDRISWLRPASASRLLGTAGTSPDAPPPRRELIPKVGPSFSPGFLADMAETQALLQQFAAVAGEDSALLLRLRSLRFIAESRWLLRREDEALAFLGAARAGVQREFAKIEAPPPTSVTLTAQGGVIPVTIHKEADYDMRVALVLRSTRLEVIGGPARDVVLTRPEQSFTFQVRAQTTGRFPVQVVVRSPGGATIADSSFVVRSTAYNKIALIVMIGAAIFLVAWWGRRFLPRRT
jgi:hypothetical protein